MVRNGLIAAGVCLALILLAGCGSGEPFSHAAASGKVTYEDGTLIPAARITVIFDPQTPPVDPSVHPKKGFATVNVADGTFSSVTSHLPNDGIVTGKHKVSFRVLDKDEMKLDIIAPDYADPGKTPILVDAAEAPFHFKIPKLKK